MYGVVMNIITTLLLAFLLNDPASPAQWGGAHSGVQETRIELISDEDSLAKAWKLTHGGSSEGQPEVDFDDSRLLLTFRGREMNLQHVVVTKIESTDQEITVTLDPVPKPLARGQQQEETTAWGLCVIPRTPEIVRVGFYASEEAGEEPEWQTIVVLKPGSPGMMSGGQQSDRRGPDPDFESYFKPDLSLLQPRRASDRDPDIDGSPHAILFEHHNKRLLFIGAVHQRDIEKAPTHKMVRTAIEGFLPQVVIVEGLSTSEGSQPERFLTTARRRLKNGQMGESRYAAVLGDEIGAIVIGINIGNF